MNRKTFFLCIGVILIFVVLHILFGGRFDFFNLDRERTPAAIFSSLQFIASGYALVTLFFLSTTRTKKMFWLTLGMMFVLLGLDEISELHENAAYYLVKYFPPFSFFQSGTPMWIVFLSPFILGACALLVIALREIYAQSRMAGRMLIGGLLLVFLALTLEFLGGLTSLQSFLPLFVVVEESAELTSGALFLWGFSTYAKEQFSIRFIKREARIDINL